MSAASQAAAQECAAVHPRRVKKRELGRDKKGHLNAAGPAASRGERSSGYDPHFLFFFFIRERETRAPPRRGNLRTRELPSFSTRTIIFLFR